MLVLKWVNTYFFNKCLQFDFGDTLVQIHLSQDIKDGYDNSDFNYFKQSLVEKSRIIDFPLDEKWVNNRTRSAKIIRNDQILFIYENNIDEGFEIKVSKILSEEDYERIITMF